MGLGRRTLGIGGTLNANLKGDATVKQFCTAAGLDVQGFPEYLASLVAQGHELGSLSNEDWDQILGPMELPRERAARVHKAVSDLRAQAMKEADERNQKMMHNHIINGGAHPNARPNAEVYQPRLNGARPKAADYQSFIPVAFFQGEKRGWTFKHGDEGLGYYRDTMQEQNSAPGSRGPSVTTNLARGYNPVSQQGLEDQMAATQQRAYALSKQQQLLIERRRRLEGGSMVYAG
jgi:hypothetical protein